MEFTHQSTDSFYKKLEAEMNKRIHAQTNTRTFTIAFGKAMETHLKQARIHRRLTTRWLRQSDLPNKDEISTISVRIVDYEEKLDFLDEAIYEMKQTQQKNQTQLQMVRKSWGELKSLLEVEAKSIHHCKIKSLESELLDLKQLFHSKSLENGGENNDEKN
ncbi:hypothetical protein [Neobacillus drentensis]|uniref:hypothetical protein n=1 Tax=Neobacillus drentensis TaxID=220684 RepID=UPI003000E764